MRNSISAVSNASAIFLGLAVAAQASASVSFTLDIDGATLNGLESPSGPVIFDPSRPRTVDGTSLLFGASTAGLEFFSVQVLDAGELAAGSDFAFSASVTLDSPTIGTNAIIALTDGVSFFGGSVDNPGTSSFPFIDSDQFLAGASSGSSLSSVANGSLFANVADSDTVLTLELDVTLNEFGRTQSTFTFVTENTGDTDPSGTVTSVSVSDDLDLSQGLSFVVASELVSQNISFDKVLIDFIPEPTSAALLVTAGTFLSTRRRKF
ncbi:MAG: PEP-CTERM sorting domain-containing protein [Planctomycetota bacterium]